MGGSLFCVGAALLLSPFASVRLGRSPSDGHQRGGGDFFNKPPLELTEPFDDIDNMLYRDSGGELPITVLGLALDAFSRSIVHAAFRRGRYYLNWMMMQQPMLAEGARLCSNLKVGLELVSNGELGSHCHAHRHTVVLAYIIW